MIGLGLGLSLELSGPRFTGLLDSYPGAAAAYSLRALTSNWLAGDVVEVRRSSDSTTQGFTASQITSGAMLDFVNNGTSDLYNSSMWFDGSDDYVSSDIGAASALYLSNSSIYGSVIFPDTATTYVVCAIGNDAGRVYVSGGTWRVGGSDTGVSFNAHQLYDFIIFCDGSGKIRSLHIDGVEVWSGTATGGTNVDTGLFLVGARTSSGTAGIFANGVILNVGIVDRVEFVGDGNANLNWEDQSSTKSVSYNSKQTLPDGQGTAAGKGATVTGLAYDNGGYLWVSNFGDDIEPVGAPYSASLMRVSLDGVTKLEEIDLTPLLGTSAGLQGVAVDTSDDTLWICEAPGDTVFNITKSGAEISSFEFTDCNGIAYDSDDDCLWVCASGGTELIKVSKSGSVLETYPVLFSEIDHLTYDSARGAVWATSGANASDGVIRIFYKGKGWAGGISTSSNSQSIEGIALNGSDVYIGNDGYYHATDTTNTLQHYSLSDVSNTNDGTVNGSPTLYTGQPFDGFVSTWYDQSGNANNATQPTTTAQPKIVDAGSLVLDADGNTAIQFDGTDDRLDCGARIVELSQNAAYVCTVSDRTGLSDTDAVYILVEGDAVSPYSSNFILGGAGAGTEVLWVNAATFGTGTSGNQLLSFTWNGTDEFQAYIDGSTSGAAGSATVNAETSNTFIGCRADETTTFTKRKITELVTWKSDQSANRAGIEENINAAYGIY